MQRSLTSNQLTAGIIVGVLLSALTYTWWSTRTDNTANTQITETPRNEGIPPSNLASESALDCSQLSAEDQELTVFSETDLQAFNGQEKPELYIGHQCLIYDVTEGGAEFYGPDQDYYYLVGRDSTAQLVQFGGDVIKSKYPVVGRLAN